MNAEILCVGTELLLGNVINTNSAFLAQELAKLGIDVYYHTVVGDNNERLKEALAIAFERSDLVITTGGMGPTYDDLTKESIADYFGLSMVLHQPTLEKIHVYFDQRPQKMTANNEKQAMIPQGAVVFDNQNGTAPGCAVTQNNKTAIMLPGPPTEMQLMFAQSVRAYLAPFVDSTLVSHTLYLFGIGESTVENLLKELMTTSTNPTIAPYAKNGEVLLRITAKAPNTSEGDRLIQPVIDQISRQLADYIYGIDIDNLQTAVVKKLLAHHKTVSSAESCTGGLISKLLTDVSGSSQVFSGGVCSYTNTVKADVLAVSPDTLAQYTAVSEETVMEMARGARHLLKTDYAVATTGIAGPDGGSDEQPVGLVYVAVVSEDIADVQKLHIDFGPLTSRDDIRQYAAKVALYRLWLAIQ